jgi:FkbM family methyltransferase
MNETEIVHDTLDWFLPLKHEQIYWIQFLQGGRTFLDIGAHVGTWTLNIAHKFERVFCFEPDPRGYEALRRNIALAGLTNVTVVPAAVSMGAGSVVLHRYPNPCTNTMMDPLKTGRTAPTDTPDDHLEVPTVGIDEFCEAKGIKDVDFIKVDAEGAELLILQGARRMFDQQRPDFFIELHGLLYERARALLPDGIDSDIIDGGGSGISLVRHRDGGWPDLPGDFRVYGPGTQPTHEDLEAMDARHVVAWKAPLEGFMSVKGE